MLPDLKKRKIGRGLSSLLGDITFSEIEGKAAAQDSLLIKEISIVNIRTNPNQPRKNFNQENIQELADSVRENGIIQPIIVQTDGNGYYTIIAGERRYRAAIMAGLEKVPCIIRDFTETEQYIVSMIENIQRSNLDPIEEALGYKNICETYNLSHAEVAKMLGKGRSHVANMIGILSMPKEIHQMLSNGEITTGHAKVLKRITNSEEVISIATKVKSETLSVRALEKHIESLTNENERKREGSTNTIERVTNLQPVQPVIPQWQHEQPQEILSMEDAFNANFPQMMHIEHQQDGTGRVIIHYTDLEDLRDVMSKMIDLAEIYAR
jgi:ParB family chromosome partitioning protein